MSEKKIPPIVHILVFLGMSYLFHSCLSGLKSSSSRPSLSESPQVHQTAPPDFLGLPPEKFFKDHSFQRSIGATPLAGISSSKTVESGIRAFAEGDYKAAQKVFKKAANETVSDPIPGIFAENAYAIRKADSLQETYLKIAATVPLGSNPTVAQEMLRGIALAQSSAHEQGRNVVIEIFDDANDPTIAREVAREIAADQSILAVIGPNASNAALEAAPIYEKAGIVMITPTSFANELSGFGEYIFRTTPNIRYLANTLAEYSVKQVRRKKIAVCYDAQAADNNSFKEEFVNALVQNGGTLIPTECNFSSPTFDAETMIRTLISDGADAVLLTPHIDRLDRMIDLSRANQWRMVLLGSPSLETRKILEIAQGDLNGVVISVPYHADMPTANAFVSSVKNRFQVTPTWRTFTSMDAAQSLVKCTQSEKDRAAIQRCLKQQEFTVPGAADSVRFLPTGDRLGRGVLAQVKPSTEGYAFHMLTTP